MDLRNFEQQLYREMPIAKAMGVRALEVCSKRLILQAPLAPNTNHKMTAFGGSIYSLAVLACWSLASETLRAEKVPFDYVMVQDACINYVNPVLGDYIAECSWLDVAARDRFLSTIRRRGMARVSMESIVRVGDLDCARLTGRFVARLGDPV